MSFHPPLAFMAMVPNAELASRPMVAFSASQAGATGAVSRCSAGRPRRRSTVSSSSRCSRSRSGPAVGGSPGARSARQRPQLQVRERVDVRVAQRDRAGQHAAVGEQPVVPGHLEHQPPGQVVLGQDPRGQVVPAAERRGSGRRSRGRSWPGSSRRCRAATANSGQSRYAACSSASPPVRRRRGQPAAEAVPAGQVAAGSATRRTPTGSPAGRRGRPRRCRAGRAATRSRSPLISSSGLTRANQSANPSRLDEVAVGASARPPPIRSADAAEPLRRGRGPLPRPLAWRRAAPPR